MKIIMLICIPLALLAGPSFSQSKRLLKELYKDHQQSFYCGCDYSYRNRGNMIDRSSCGYKPRIEKSKKGKINSRSRRIEWEHVMPAQNFGRHLSCWKEGGRKRCSQSSKEFRRMEADMVNLVPAIGELNGDRSNFRYGAAKAVSGQYGSCEFNVDFKGRRALVRPSIRGDIARIYLYMSDTYKIPLSKQERQMMEAWDKSDPADGWELLKKEKIEQSLQKNE